MQLNIKKQVFKVVLGIAIFTLFYLALLALSFELCNLAYEKSEEMDIVNLFNESVVGALLLGLLLWVIPIVFTLNTVMVLFKVKRFQRNDIGEITKESCPELYAMIKEVVKEAHCSFPKHIYITPDVNASVFYNTYFWNIFLPVRKNLNIGAALIASLSIDELKAVLAHEFGHFSQDSMKAGSAMSIANQVMQNLTNGNGPWDRFMYYTSKVAGVHLYTFILWYLLFGVTWVINYSLKTIARLTNEAESSLSRQMEYEADGIAARIVGSNVVASALRRLSFAGKCFEDSQLVINNIARKEQKKVSDIFLLQDAVVRFVSEWNDVKWEANNLLKENIESSEIKSRVRYLSKYATHPSMDERIENLPANIKADVNLNAAYNLIPENTRQALTGNYYSEKTKDWPVMTNEDMIRQAQEILSDSLVPKDFQAFINHDIGPFNLDVEKFQLVANPFTAENRMAAEEYNVAASDFALLQNLSDHADTLDSFVYNGEECHLDSVLIDKHCQYLNSLLDKLNKIDYDILQFLYFHYAGNEDAQQKLLYMYDLLFRLTRFMSDRKELHDSDFADFKSGDLDRDILAYRLRQTIAIGVEIIAHISSGNTLAPYRNVCNNPHSTIEHLVEATNSLFELMNSIVSDVKLDLAKAFKESI